jgi:hypothetical protein
MNQFVKSSWLAMGLILATSGRSQIPVTDALKVQTLGLIQAVNQNKQQQLENWNTTSEDKLVAMVAMEAAFGDKSGIELYRPMFSPAFWPELTTLVEKYAKGMPDKPEFNNVRIYLEDLRQRESVIQTYGAMILERQKKAEAKQESLTILDYAAISSSLINQGMEMRMTQIEETAQRTSLNAIQQARKTELMEMRFELKALDRIK